MVFWKTSQIFNLKHLFFHTNAGLSNQCSPFAPCQPVWGADLFHLYFVLETVLVVLVQTGWLIRFTVCPLRQFSQQNWGLISATGCCVMLLHLCTSTATEMGVWHVVVFVLYASGMLNCVPWFCWWSISIRYIIFFQMIAIWGISHWPEKFIEHSHNLALHLVVYSKRKKRNLLLVFLPVHVFYMHLFRYCGVVLYYENLVREVLRWCKFSPIKLKRESDHQNTTVFKKNNQQTDLLLPWVFLRGERGERR